MIAKCECQSCGQGIEFPAAEFDRTGETSHRFLGPTIACPSCGNQTQLYMAKVLAQSVPTPPPVPTRPAAMEREFYLIPCPTCKNAVSNYAFQCPGCGHAIGIRFKIIWRIFCWIILVSFIWGILAFILGAFLQGFIEGVRDVH